MLKRLFKLSTFVLTATLIFMNIPVFAESNTKGDTTVEGDTTRFVTGAAYASQIEIAGYNFKTGKLYMNLEFDMPSDSTSTLNYYVNVYNNSSNNIGAKGTDATPETVSYTAGATTVTAANVEVSLSEALTAGYRTVVTVESRN
ncbi:hypothetical protein CIB95_00205 [Lottiidibacillus patelloidae]|uniref:NEAT domain-containing protein n=1 Tax=Lottiidibacillus patelloidae TaxID=2670334 RepID=A0A263BXK7_9BACI|nr:hypothetical protein [Lottiidibacillus patelloidae]OZM58037.1 hypothetical protein CIB95_00205 [Lottiidibacillus patelloidae]